MKHSIRRNMVGILVLVLVFHSLVLSLEINLNSSPVKNWMSENSSVIVQPTGLCIQHQVLCKSRNRNSEILSYMILPQSVTLKNFKYIQKYRWTEGEQAGATPYVIRYIQNQDGKK